MDRISQKSEKIYCGIDFHKNESVLYAITANGQKVEKLKVKSDRLVQYLSNKKDWVLGIEISGGVNQKVMELRASGHEVKLINSNKFRGIGIGGKKTDERDAKALAECLRFEFTPEVHLKSEGSRRLKSMLVCREFYVRSRVNGVNHVRGTLREYGLNIPQGMESFRKNVGGEIDKIDHPQLKSLLEKTRALITELEECEKAAEKILEDIAVEDGRVQNLLTVPGIGLMTAVAMICVVDECSRFKNGKEFASYIGLVPSVHASADKCMMGSITRSGCEILRRYLIHGARAWMKYKPDSDKNRVWAERVLERRGANKATVALAHRMARISFSILRDGVPYTGKAKRIRLRKTEAA